MNRRRNRLVAALGAALAVLGVILLPVTGGAPANLAQAADTSQFQAGNIITDQLFFDGSAMSAAAVQTFLNVRNPSCVAGAMPCLKDYQQTTPTRGGSSSCPGTYTGATNESAATIIAKVGQACGISQRVLVVVLQKEEGLVTASGSSLSTTRYRSATGFGCPDTAACDSTYYGFFNQVYAAASQYRKYASNPNNYSHRAGMTNNILYNPSASCGSSPVYIANQATAGLYNYTPYQPNAAALAAGAGSGDSCSAYGNRNFWIYFTSWFGSTQTAGAGDLADLYVATGADNGPLGPVTEGVTCGLRGGGCRQGYANGSIYWSAATGAHAMLGAIETLWKGSGAENGVLGYPTQSVSTMTGGQYALFEHGSIYWTPATGAHAMLGPIETLWKAWGARTGVLGLPTWSVSNLPGGGQYALFEHGSIYWTPATGAHAMLGPIEAFWRNGGAQNGVLGYPIQSVTTLSDGGQYALFQHGSVYWSSATGAHALLGPIQDAWQASGGTTGALGYPSWSVSNLPDGGQYATFKGGSVYWSAATGARTLSGPVRDAWIAAGAQTSALGYPTQDVKTAADGVGQYAQFQHGAIYCANGATLTLTEQIRDAWVIAGADRGVLGAPTSSSTVLADTVGQAATFQHGSIYWSAGTGAHVVSGAIQALWTAQGAEAGPLGYPTSDVTAAGVPGSQVATFQHGTVYWSAGTGAHVVSGPVQVKWAAVGSERGVLGLPTQDVTATADGKGQHATFEHGSIYSTPATGTWVMLGPIETVWAAAGAERGFLGYPVQSVSWAADHVGQYARFQRGVIFWSPGSGAHEVLGAIGGLWAATGAEHGVLGYPVSDELIPADGVGRFSRFQHGSIFWSPTTGARVMMGPIETLWNGTGAERGLLGYPVQSVSWAADHVGQYARFQGGSIYWSPATGTRAMLGAIEQRWRTDGAERGRMGYPVQSVSWAADHVGQYARFQGGSIYWSPATGAWEVRGPFLTAWAGVGYEHGVLGYPIGEPYAVTGGQWQKFQHGYVALSTASGRSWAVHQ